MKALFGVVSLLVVLAVVGLLTAQQLRGTRIAPVPAMPGTASAPGAMSAATGNPPGAADAQATSPKQVQQQMRDDLNRALEQGARRNEAAP